MNHHFSILILLIIISNCYLEEYPIKLFKFDYSNIEPKNDKLISVLESVDYYINLLIKKKEVKDYNRFNELYNKINSKKYKCIKKFQYSKSLIIQKDISYLILPSLVVDKKNKNIEFSPKTLCKDIYGIPRVVSVTLVCKDKYKLVSMLTNDIQKNYIFSRFMKVILGHTLLDLKNLKRNKLIYPFPEKYGYYSSFMKFKEFTQITNKKIIDRFREFGNKTFWPNMEYFDDYLQEGYTSRESLKLSFTEITLNLLREYNYDLSLCDIFYYKNKCLRFDRKCKTSDELNGYFLEYFIDETKKRLICNLKNETNIKKRMCGIHYGHVFYEDEIKYTRLNPFLKSKGVQNLLMLNPSEKCPKNYPKTIFFEYMDEYRDDPYYYHVNNIDVEYMELKDPNQFVIAKLDKNKNFMGKYRCLTFNNIFTSTTDRWNYNLYWDLYPTKDELLFNNYNQYQLLGKFIGEDYINMYNIIYLNNKLKQKFRHDFNYITESYSYPEQKKIINDKFNNYKFNIVDSWSVYEKNKTTNSYILKSPKQIDSINNKEYILNKYITNPLLINGKRFIMKTFVLVTGFSPLKIYFYKDGYITFDKNNYILNEKTVKKGYTGSICNDEIINDRDYYARSIFDEKSCTWNFISLERFFAEKNINYNDIIKQMKDIIIKTFISLSSKIDNNGINERKMFQLFSFDLIMGDTKKIFLIDVDRNPPLKSLHMGPMYIYDHLLSDVLNIVGVVPFRHEVNFGGIKNDNKIKENVEEAVCEFTRPRGIFELVFPIKSNIEKYRKFFDEIDESNKLLWDKVKEEK